MTITLKSQANQDLSQAKEIITAAYKQVFGNRHLMELDTCPSVEALFMNGDLTVQGLITALGQSETYKRFFLYTNSPYRFVELNFKHFLGRPPRDQSEVSEHVMRLANEGFEAEIASYTYSDEYLNSFGIDQVPYTRTNKSIIASSTLAYQRTFALSSGSAGFDASGTSVLRRGCFDNQSNCCRTRKVVGSSNSYTILWTSSRQIGTSRKSSQRSVVSYASLSNTIKSIQSQGGRILTITGA